MRRTFGMRRARWSCCLCIVTVIASMVIVGQPALAIQSLVEMRLGGVVQQTDWATCGAAAIATLLSKYFGTPIDEAAVLQTVDWVTDLPSDVVRGLTLSDLAQALGALGVSHAAFRMDFDALEAFVVEHALPVLVHFEKPRPHYVLYVGRVGEAVAVDDPSWGERTLPVASFLDRYSGFAIVAVPPQQDWGIVHAARRSTLQKHEVRLGALQHANHRTLTRWSTF